MRRLLQGARALATQWLGVSVPREANGEADRLSHPHMLGEVATEARGVGLEVRTARIPGSCWAGLREAAALTVGDAAR
eukprot:3645918-Pleurochrysis_carterae.AAC.1